MEKSGGQLELGVTGFAPVERRVLSGWVAANWNLDKGAGENGDRMPDAAEAARGSGRGPSTA